jgi:hypothetical protein
MRASSINLLTEAQLLYCLTGARQICQLHFRILAGENHSIGATMKGGQHGVSNPVWSALAMFGGRRNVHIDTRPELSFGSR